MSVSTENFIKTIYTLETGQGKDSRPGTIASALKVSNAAATDMARKMASRGLINYIKYKPITLTEEGRRMALSVLRKHRLWELFLHKTFGMSLMEIHREAEMLEHQTSDFLTEKISAFLGDPKYDPHGDPIPDVNGEMNIDADRILLADAVPGESYFLNRLYSSDREVLDFCEANGMQIGTPVKVEKQLYSSGMTEIIVRDLKILLNKEITQVIYLSKKRSIQ